MTDAQITAEYNRIIATEYWLAIKKEINRITKQEFECQKTNEVSSQDTKLSSQSESSKS